VAAEEPVERFVLKDDQKFIRGKNGRMFLANDSNKLLSQHSGEVRFSDDDLRRWRLTLETRAAWLEQRGCAYFFLVPPNAHSVFPEDLPDDVRSAPERPIHQLMRCLEEAGSDVHFTYPLEELVAEKHGELPVYPVTDTHWTAWGEFIAYRRLVEDMQARGIELDPVEADSVGFRTVKSTGDLGYKVEPNQYSDTVRAHVRGSRSRRLYDNNLVPTTGAIIITERDDGAPTRCLVFGDSYSYGVLEFLAETFSRVMFVHTPTLDFSIVAEESPDVVVSILNERFLIMRPSDLPGLTVRDIAAEKEAVGELRPRTSNWG
jgi:hypothetical protein